jgi:hypothetical protein
MGVMGFLKKVAPFAGVALAPFTGGMSLGAQALIGGATGALPGILSGDGKGALIGGLMGGAGGALGAAGKAAGNAGKFARVGGSFLSNLTNPQNYWTRCG